jgi:hypothetical protein
MMAEEVKDIVMRLQHTVLLRALTGSMVCGSHGKSLPIAGLVPKDVQPLGKMLLRIFQGA